MSCLVNCRQVLPEAPGLTRLSLNLRSVENGKQHIPTHLSLAASVLIGAVKDEQYITIDVLVPSQRKSKTLHLKNKISRVPPKHSLLKHTFPETTQSHGFPFCALPRCSSPASMDFNHRPFITSHFYPAGRWRPHLTGHHTLRSGHGN